MLAMSLIRSPDRAHVPASTNRSTSDRSSQRVSSGGGTLVKVHTVRDRYFDHAYVVFIYRFCETVDQLL